MFAGPVHRLVGESIVGSANTPGSIRVSTSAVRDGESHCFGADEILARDRTSSFWVVSAKQEETRQRRLAKLISDSENGRRLGMRPPKGKKSQDSENLPRIKKERGQQPSLSRKCHGNRGKTRSIANKR